MINFLNFTQPQQQLISYLDGGNNKKWKHNALIVIFWGNNTWGEV